MYQAESDVKLVIGMYSPHTQSENLCQEGRESSLWGRTAVDSSLWWHFGKNVLLAGLQQVTKQKSLSHMNFGQFRSGCIPQSSFLSNYVWFNIGCRRSCIMHIFNPASKIILAWDIGILIYTFFVG